MNVDKSNNEIHSYFLIPVIYYDILLPNLEENVQIVNLWKQNELENHHQTSHTWPSEPILSPQTT